MQQLRFLPSWATASAIVFCSFLMASPAWSDSVYDSLLVLNADGQSYTAQHTLTTDSANMALALPAGRVTLLNHFSGPGKLASSIAHEQNPDRLAVSSGSGMTRYRLNEDDSLQLSENGSVLQHILGRDINLDIDDLSTLHTTVTWVLPDEASFLSFTDTQHPDDKSADNPGRWQTSANTLSYSQQGGNHRILTISIRLFEHAAAEPNPCLAITEQTDECAPDLDNDSVPDYRDVCLQGPDESNSSAARDIENDANESKWPSSRDPENDSDESKNSLSHDAENDAIGCNNAEIITLEGVQFQSGQSYLDVSSRQVLDRVAIALQRVPDQLFEVSSHTDNGGRVSHNQRLSENRADAVRHYLMLRGLGPNQLAARGYGEVSPAHNNSTAEGRRANRRIELKRLN